MLSSSPNPYLRGSVSTVALRSLVAIVAICVALAWVVSANNATVDTDHRALHATSIGHSAHDRCCTSGFDCQCSPATAITALTDEGLPSTRDAWSPPVRRSFVAIHRDRPYHPPRRSLIT